MSAIVIDRQIVHYEVLGRGRPLIFLHGWVGSWRYWIPAMQALSSEYRTYALDFWGFGDTARNSEGYSLSGQAELIFKFMDQLGIIRAAFVGHSLGGVAGLDFAIRHADYADRLMLVSTPLFGAALNPRFVNAETGALTEWLLGREPGMEQVSRPPKLTCRPFRPRCTRCKSWTCAPTSHCSTRPPACWCRASAIRLWPCPRTRG
ncbi:MAG: alpha/beta fold hydrolase [Chloroflexi bacterium]|nr:alpha/beta fold hydrolase [Chloroflexota bacterium]